MPWAKWDLDLDHLHSTMRDLPSEIADLPVADLKQLGYLPLIIEWPDDLIERFHELAGPPTFRIEDDGAVHQTFAEADFSVAAVRERLVVMINQSAQSILAETDWVFIRQLETGEAPDPEVLLLRKRQRDHLVWLKDRVANADERELVEFQWMWPKQLDHVMIDGRPVIHKIIDPEGVITFNKIGEVQDANSR